MVVASSILDDSTNFSSWFLAGVLCVFCCSGLVLRCMVGKEKEI
jgi:hypothetical protein